MINDDLIVFAAHVAVNNVLDFVHKEIDAKTPEDTKFLIGSSKKRLPKVEDGKVVGAIYNDAPYVGYVEDGVGGKEYNYHKPRSAVFYEGVGAGMFKRTRFDQKVKDISQKIIKGTVDKFIKKITLNGK